MQESESTLSIRGRITLQLVSSLTRLDFTKKENMLFLYLCSDEVKSLLKLDTIHTVILPPMLCVLCKNF